MFIQAEMFAKPRGNIRGIVTIYVGTDKNSVHLASAKIFTDAEPEVSIKYAPKRISVDYLSEIAKALDQLLFEIRKYNA